MSEYGRDYIERKIEMVRNHRDFKNPLRQWANIFADEVERCWVELERVEAERNAATEMLAMQTDALAREREKVAALRQALVMAEGHLSLLRYRGTLSWGQPGLPEISEVDKTITDARNALADSSSERVSL